MHGLCLDDPLHKWFDMKTTKTTIAPDYIINILLNEETQAFQPNNKLVWLGNKPEMEIITKSKKGRPKKQKQEPITPIEVLQEEPEKESISEPEPEAEPEPEQTEDTFLDELNNKNFVEEVKPTKGPIKGKLTIIDEAIKDTKILDIIYNGGSIPGVKRPIRPLRIFKTYKGKSILEATCLIEDAPRRFIIDNLTIA
jgi:hypothetical protein